MINQRKVIEVLRTIKDPSIKGDINVYDLGLIREIDVNIETSYVKILMTLTDSINSSMKTMDAVGEAVNNMEEVKGVKIDLTFTPPWDATCILQGVVKLLGKDHPLVLEGERLRTQKDLSVTDEARDRLNNLLKEEGYDEGGYVRVAVESGGCSGLKYDLSFSKYKHASDRSFEDNGIKVVIEKKSFPYIQGTTLEYSGGLNGKGFVFNNPNANRTCGCGESFSL